MPRQYPEREWLPPDEVAKARPADHFVQRFVSRCKLKTPEADHRTQVRRGLERGLAALRRAGLL